MRKAFTLIEVILIIAIISILVAILIPQFTSSESEPVPTRQDDATQQAPTKNQPKEAGKTPTESPAK